MNPLFLLLSLVVGKWSTRIDETNVVRQGTSGTLVFFHAVVVHGLELFYSWLATAGVYESLEATFWLATLSSTGTQKTKNRREALTDEP